MPSVPLDKIPLPSLQTYTAVSVLLFSCSIYYALQVTSAPDWVLSVPETVNPNEDGLDFMVVDSNKIALHKMLINNSKTKRMYELLSVITEEPLCVWTLINMVYCVMILIGKGIQKAVFGKLRVVEKQHMKDKFWNFVFYKFIFIFGVMNVQNMDEVVMWCGWFSFVGAFHLLSMLCKDRFEYLSFSPTTSKWTHVRLFIVLFSILSISVSLCTIVGLYASLNIFFFMAAEWTLVIIRTLYTLVRYVIHLYDVTREGIWERRGICVYYCELVCDLSSLVVDFLHHLHMLLWRNIFLSVASLVICMQLRCFINDIQRKITRHKNYLRVSKHMEINFPLATKAEIEANSDDCAICWDRMEIARKLPCGHMFHASCLHSWLEQVTNCPTCRTSLVPKQNTHGANEGPNLLGQDPRQPSTTNHFFHFDGSRYVSWLPSFSVEVSHTSLLGERPTIITARNSQLDSMVHQVLQMFPHMPYNLVLEDLLISHSVEHTVENILEERLTAPPPANRPPNVHTFHTAPLVGLNPNPIQLREPAAPEPADSSDSGVSDNTARSEEPILITGGEGCRFSKNSQEREQMLFHRKEDLLRKAKSKYVSRILNPRSKTGESTSSSE